MSLGTVQLGPVGPFDHHAAAGLSTIGASTFPEEYMQKSF